MSPSLKDQEIAQILNVRIDNLSMLEVLERLKQGLVVTPNVAHLMKLQTDAEFAKIYEKADYRLCDSQILIYASYFLGTPLKEKISGSDFFPTFCRFHRHNPEIRIFLLGGAQGVPEKAAANLNRKVGREIVVDALSPSFQFEHNSQECLDILDRINQSQATVLAVGVGAPKQEKWIYQHKDKLPNVKIFMAIGATINFEAGVIKRAPHWMGNSGLEWLYRIISEPRRLWKRYLFDSLPFLYLLLKQKLGLYRPPFCISLQQFNPMNKLKVVMLGPCLHQQGGMASVETTIVQQASADVEIEHISTHREGTKFDRVKIFAVAILQLLNKLLNHSVDVVHLHVSERGSVLRIGLLAQLSRLFHKPVILHTHGSEFHIFYDRLSKAGKRWVASIFQHSAYVITLSEAWKKYYTSTCQLAADKVVVAYNPVEVPDTIPPRSTVGRVRFVFLGRIGHRKGTFDLIRAFAQLPQQYQMQAELTIAGDGEIEKARSLIAAFKLQDLIKLAGWIGPDQRNQLLQTSDAFILPSYNEGLPVALLEAMAWQLPVITTSVGGIPDLVRDQGNGILIEPGNILQLTAAMQTLIENESLRQQLGIKARQQVMPLRVDHYCNALRSLYHAAILTDRAAVASASRKASNFYE